MLCILMHRTWKGAKAVFWEVERVGGWAVVVWTLGFLWGDRGCGIRLGLSVKSTDGLPWRATSG